MNLRPYQEKLINGVRYEMARGKKRIIAYLPTGAGKTVVAVGIIQLALAKGMKVAFVCNRIQLIQQTAETFTRLGIPHGIIQGSNTCSPWSSVLICSIQTIARRGLPEVDLIIIDECHAVAGTKAYAEIMAGKFTIGLTATPYQKGLGRHCSTLGGDLFEGIVVGADMREMIQNGFLVDADVWAPADPDLTGVKVVAGDYQEEQLGAAMNKPSLIGDIVAHWFKHSHGKQTMVFAVNIAHSQSICAQFRAAGIAAVHVDYHMSDLDKAEIYADFKAGESMVLCNCALLSEGADFPACETLILARPTKSKVRFVQMFGRVLRPSKATGKERAIVLDHSGTVKRLGFPWDFSVTHLDDGKPKKASQSEAQDKPEALPKPCPKCAFMRAPKVNKCPNCGHETRRPSEIETEEGELVQLKGKPKAQKTLESMGKASIYAQLCKVAQDRQKGESWINANYKGIFGTWPRQDYALEEPSAELLSWIRHRQIAWANSKKKQEAEARLVNHFNRAKELQEAYSAKKGAA